MANEPKRGLGRGLSALLGEEAAAPGGGDPARTLPIDRIDPNPEQPRRQFDDNDLAELAASIREKGLLQPILVRPSPVAPGRYQVVAGERRWRASQLAGLRQVPVVERNLDDAEAMEIAIIENVQRSDLTAVEEAFAYRSLMDQFGRTQDAVAETVGKSRSHVANTIRLLNLPVDVLTELSLGRLSAGHARALLASDDPEALSRRVIAEGLNVRQTEALVRKAAQGERAPRPKAHKPADTAAFEKELSDMLGLAVRIDDKDGKGEVRVAFKSYEQLDAICQKLMAHIAPTPKL